MPKRSSKRKDTQELAPSVPNQAVPGAEPAAPAREKNPAAVALGRLGGLKGGKARAESLTEEQRSQIAASAARARWANHRKHDDEH